MNNFNRSMGKMLAFLRSLWESDFHKPTPKIVDGRELFRKDTVPGFTFSVFIDGRELIKACAKTYPDFTGTVDGYMALAHMRNACLARGLRVTTIEPCQIGI